jgi:hypothetical protein
MEAVKQAKRTVVLIGDPSSKRTLFFKAAAKALGVPFCTADWNIVTETFDLDMFKGAAVKIDPPSYSTIRLSRMQEQLHEYRRKLRHLANADSIFFNSPEAICAMLQKRKTNRLLKERGIPVTEMFHEEIKTARQLEEVLRERRCYSVFVKPECFSGAAGVAAFRLHPVTGSRKLYTSCRLEESQLVNTKRLVCMEDAADIQDLLDQLLSLGCVVERWHPKAAVRGRCYDLRIVCQLGHITSAVARQSMGPITNLHLNNQAVCVDALGLDDRVLHDIASTCQKAYDTYCGCLEEEAAFPSFGMHMAGIDLLLEKGTMRPRIIEMNGQGDLIYRDIYGENRIYQEQIRWLSEI